MIKRGHVIKQGGRPYTYVKRQPLLEILQVLKVSVCYDLMKLLSVGYAFTVELLKR